MSNTIILGVSHIAHNLCWFQWLQLCILVSIYFSLDWKEVAYAELVDVVLVLEVVGDDFTLVEDFDDVEALLDVELVVAFVKEEDVDDDDLTVEVDRVVD